MHVEECAIRELMDRDEVRRSWISSNHMLSSTTLSSWTLEFFELSVFDFNFGKPSGVRSNVVDWKIETIEFWMNLFAF